MNTASDREKLNGAMRNIGDISSAKKDPVVERLAVASEDYERDTIYPRVS